jgi:hypothetical protein
MMIRARMPASSRWPIPSSIAFPDVEDKVRLTNGNTAVPGDFNRTRLTLSQNTADLPLNP